MLFDKMLSETPQSLVHHVIIQNMLSESVKKSIGIKGRVSSRNSPTLMISLQ